MPQVKYKRNIHQGAKVSERSAEAGVPFVANVGNLFAGSRIQVIGLLHLAPERNPYADSNGRPISGYRRQYYTYELEQKKKYLNSLSEEKRNEIYKSRQALYERMQS